MLKFAKTSTSRTHSSLKMKPLLWASLLLLLAPACTNLYFEKPVPQNGQPLLAPPPDLQGVYEVLDDDPSEQCEAPGPFEQWAKPCYIFEKLDAERLMVSQDVRFHERDFPQIKARLARQKADGELTDYTMTERGIFYTTAAAPDSSSKARSGYVPLLRSGAWYIFTRTQKPVKMYHFAAQNGVEQSFEAEPGKEGGDALLPDADSLSTKTSLLVARQRAGAFFLNTRAEGDPGWSLTWCQTAPSGELLLKFSSRWSADTLIENNRAHYEAITPLGKTPDDDYLLNPDDRALDALLADPKLFEVMRLKKLKD
jgi:hypothetical protein